ncbi:hypothetical protein CEXT_808441 [Caerostris extrusa]|uniref:Uncharacterized protein n=1 Tax=Caerostris extrusa TaxID=172846 RepID=A0AAV4SNR3_CAEEX|nr:hypothetical protein CEXT_808441 [Caerostris extrusa]
MRFCVRAADDTFSTLSQVGQGPLALSPFLQLCSGRSHKKPLRGLWGPKHPSFFARTQWRNTGCSHNTYLHLREGGRGGEHPLFHFRTMSASNKL